MLRKWYKAVGILLTVLPGFLPLTAQEYLINTKVLTTTDGLSHNQTNAILQDEEGFIWLGTEYGLNRFDGHRFQFFTKEANHLSFNSINQLFQDHSGWLWLVNTQNLPKLEKVRSVDLFHPRTFQVIPLKEKYPNLFRLLNGDIIGIRQFPDRGFLIELANGKYFRLFNDSFSEHFLPADFRIIKLGDKCIWGQQNNQLVQLDLEGAALQSIEINENKWIWDIQEDHQKRIWITMCQRDKKDNRIQFSNANLVVWENNQFRTILQPKLKNHPKFIRIIDDPHLQAVWLINRDQITLYDHQLQVRFSNGTLFKQYTIRRDCKILLDRNHVFWIPADRHLVLLELKPSLFRQYLADRTGVRYSCRGIIQIGDTLIINSNQPTTLIDLNSGSEKQLSWDDREGLELAFRFFPIEIARDGTFWTANDRLYQFDKSARLTKEIQVTKPYRQRGPRIWSFFQDTSLTWWMGTGAKNLYSYRENRDTHPVLFTNYNGFEILKEAPIWHFSQDATGIWVAAQNGLYLLDPQKGILARYSSDQEKPYYLPAREFYFIYQDSTGVLWLATRDSGLIIFDPEKQTYRQLSRVDGLPSNELYAILEDSNRYLWISSANGLIQLNKESLQFNVFYEEQGICHNEFNRLSYFQAEDSTIYLGGLNGVTAFHPSDFAQNEQVFPILLSAAFLYPEHAETPVDITSDISSGKPIRFYPDDNLLSIELSVQDYMYADKINYSYQIAGRDHRWNKIDGSTFQLTSLPYGTHDIHFKGEGPGFRYSKNPLVVTVIVPKPVYLRLWFLILVATAIGLGIWWYFRQKTQDLVKRQIQLETLVNQRTQKIESDKHVIEQQAAELKALNETKNRFFANISHELRTPLTLIKGPLSRLIKKNSFSKNDQELARMIQKNSMALERRINELLDLSKLEARELKPEPESVNLNSFTRRVAALFESNAHQQKIDYIIGSDLPTGNALLDRKKVETILHNFLSNALKFTPANGSIHIDLELMDQMVRWSVTDTGPGIPPGEKERIFDRFYQVQTTQQEAGQGTGIGLALCRELARLMDGKVWVESNPGIGSTFFFEMPFQQGSPEQVDAEVIPLVKEEPGIQPTPSKGQSPFRILLVEDNPDLRIYLSDLLQEYQIKTAVHGAEALEMLQTEPFDLIISDVMMPVMDGFTLLTKLKKEDRWADIPVIMLTAKAGIQSKLEALRIGVDDYMLKPFLEEELLVRIKNALKRLQQRQHSQDEPENDVIHPQQKWLQEVEAIVLQQLSDKSINLDRIADAVFLSKRQLQRRIKSATGMTSSEYLREIRLHQARTLLESGDYQTVAEVSHAVGFEHTNYFSRIYADRFGKRPIEYLR